MREEWPHYGTCVWIASGAHPASYRIGSWASQQLYQGLAVLAASHIFAPPCLHAFDLICTIKPVLSRVIVLMTCIVEMPGSNPDYPYWRFSWCLWISSSYGQMTGEVACLIKHHVMKEYEEWRCRSRYSHLWHKTDLGYQLHLGREWNTHYPLNRRLGGGRKVFPFPGMYDSSFALDVLCSASFQMNYSPASGHSTA